MKYTNQVTINKPKNEVIELFQDPEHLKDWQPGFVSMEHISGTPGEDGAKSKLKYKAGKRDIEMTETILKNGLPDTFDSVYETKNVYNIQHNRFEAIDDNTTQWISDSEFRFSGIMKLFGFFMPGAFKKQSQQYLDMFKDFAEKHS